MQQYKFLILKASLLTQKFFWYFLWPCSMSMLSSLGKSYGLLLAGQHIPFGASPQVRLLNSFSAMNIFLFYSCEFYADLYNWLYPVNVFWFFGSGLNHASFSCTSTIWVIMVLFCSLLLLVASHGSVLFIWGSSDQDLFGILNNLELQVSCEF